MCETNHGGVGAGCGWVVGWCDWQFCNTGEINDSGIERVGQGDSCRIGEIVTHRIVLNIIPRKICSSSSDSEAFALAS